MKAQSKPYVATTNACKLCKPLGACLAFKGIEGAVPYLHGSQGCATYMRRYIISHFREPMDIASSSLGEKHAIYGGGPNLKLGLKNVMTKYKGGLIGVATTCLTETIGDDVSLLMHEFCGEFDEVRKAHNYPDLVNVSTPSYSGTHMEGFHAAVKAVVTQLAGDDVKSRDINLMPGFVSPADVRYLKEVLGDFGVGATVLPDISLTLDGSAEDRYDKISPGGTPVSRIKVMGGISRPSSSAVPCRCSYPRQRRWKRRFQYHAIPWERHWAAGNRHVFPYPGNAHGNRNPGKARAGTRETGRRIC